MKLASLYDPALAISEGSEPLMAIAYQPINTPFIRWRDMLPGIGPSFFVFIPGGYYWKRYGSFSTFYRTKQDEIDGYFFSANLVPNRVRDCDKPAATGKRRRPFVSVLGNIA